MTKTGFGLLVSVLVLTGCAEPPPPEKSLVRPVKAMQIAATKDFEGRSFPGTARATQEVELSFRVAGPLISFPIEVGQTVSEGELLAQIDPRDYDVKLRNVQGQLQEARATFKSATDEYNREKRIFDKDPGATSQRAIDRANERRERSRASVNSLEASVAAAEDQLSYTQLKAPFAGTIVATYAENFEDVRSKQAVARLVDDSRVEMIVNIPESFISMTPQVKNVRVRFDAFPDRQVPAEIKEIGTEASEVTRTYPVTLIMNQPEDFKILPGMSGGVSGDPPDEMLAVMGALTVPVGATFAVGEETHVWVIDPEKRRVTKRKISTGMLTNAGIGVTKGLNAGDWIATAGVHFLKEGQEVRLLESDGG